MFTYKILYWLAFLNLRISTRHKVKKKVKYKVNYDDNKCIPSIEKEINETLVISSKKSFVIVIYEITTFYFPNQNSNLQKKKEKKR